MNAVDFSTGVRVQCPSDASTKALCFDWRNFAFGAQARAITIDDDRRQLRWEEEQDVIKYAACQEMAYAYAVEQTQSTVTTVLRKANAKCYDRVRRYMERYMVAERSIGGAERTNNVAFPAYHPFPTAAIITGTDATASDVWMRPLCHVLKTSFPFMFVIKDEIKTARELLEWLVDQLDRAQSARAAEESWLVEELEQFQIDIFTQDVQEEVVEEEEAPSVGIGRRRLRRQAAQRRQVTPATSTPSLAEDQDEAYVFESSSSSSGDDEEDDRGGRSRSRNKKQKKSVDNLNKIRKRFAKWTIHELMDKIRSEMNLMMDGEDSCQQLIDPLLDQVQEALAFALDSTEVTDKSCCFERAIRWLTQRLATFESRLRQSQQRQDRQASVVIRDTRYYLARTIQQILLQYLSSLENEAPDVRKRMQLQMLKLERDYDLPSNTNDSNQKSQKPYFLICIEQLEAFNLQVLEDFLTLWSNHMRQCASIHQRGLDPLTQWRFGLVVGIASSSSPALRRLSLSVVSHIDMQFFSLEDSTKCFDDIIETLVVVGMLPLQLSGNVLEWIARLHRKTQSITAFLHALEYLLFDHFGQVPWSFLSHFGMEQHYKHPLRAIKHMPWAVRLWIRHGKLGNASSASDHLQILARHQLDHLQVMLGLTDDSEWLKTVEQALETHRKQRRRWMVGWKCFRAACAWLEIELKGASFVTALAAALDGQLARSDNVRLVLERIGTSRLQVLHGLVQDWHASCQDDRDLSSTLNELELVCQFSLEHVKDKTTMKMQANLRHEISTLFLQQIICAMLQSPSSKTEVDQVVRQWMSLHRVDLLQSHLHLNYYNALQQSLLMTDKTSLDPSTASTDVGLALHYYREHAGVHMSWNDWYAAFVTEIRQEATEEAKALNESIVISDTEAQARFIRAFCTLRHWGFVDRMKNGRGDPDTIEKLVFI